MATPNSFPSAGFFKSTGGNTFTTNMALDSGYVYSVQGATPAATPSDIITLTGSASKIVRVRKVIVSGLATTAGALPMALIRRSTAASGGTATNPTPLRLDPRDPDATATFALYTANPTPGTAVDTLANFRVNLGLAAAIGPQIVLDFSETPGIVLRGTSDILAINGTGAAVPGGGVLDINIYWSEE